MMNGKMKGKMKKMGMNPMFKGGGNAPAGYKPKKLSRQKRSALSKKRI